MAYIHSFKCVKLNKHTYIQSENVWPISKRLCVLYACNSIENNMRHSFRANGKEQITNNKEEEEEEQGENIHNVELVDIYSGDFTIQWFQSMFNQLNFTGYEL